MNEKKKMGLSTKIFIALLAGAVFGFFINLFLPSGVLKDDILINGVMGLCGESGEAIDLVKKHLHQGHPLDREKLIELSQRFQHIVTVEEHSIVGGFGSAVCEVIAEAGSACRVHRIGMEDVYSTIVGTQDYLRGEYRMDAKAICERAIAWLNA